MEQRLWVEIHGAVQGVGFRPFVYRLATELSLTGWVINNSQGVFIEVEGSRDLLEEFIRRLSSEKPLRSIIRSMDISWLDLVGYERFEIRHSEAGGAKTVLVMPEIAICADCLAEILNPADRRYRYPFTNCTNCGPRFTIVDELPYDRPNTSMRHFAMCAACQAEYDDPRNRRFHAQPNACPDCGPQLMLYRPESKNGRSRSNRRMRTDQLVNLETESSPLPFIAEKDAALHQAAVALLAGQIVAVKGLGGFHLMVDARNPEAVARLRQRKSRYDKPLAVMVPDLAWAQILCQISAEETALLISPEAPIVLLERRSDTSVAENVAPGNPNLGVMLPYAPLHHLLLNEIGIPVVATSGNLSDEPICIDAQEAMDRLEGIADLYLVHDRPIVRHVDDSVTRVILGESQILRRARGYAPLPVPVGQSLPVILGVGAHLKNTIALSIGPQVFISQHIGDLETPQAVGAFQRVVADFLRLYEASPVAVAVDMHPDYYSTRWAQAWCGGEGTGPVTRSRPVIIPVQHHHAHLASCLAENGVSDPALGIVWDGTGYGPDRTIWGGEFLLGDTRDFGRVASFRPFLLPGGEQAIKEPARIAFALLSEIYGDAILEWEDLAPIRHFRVTDRRLLLQMVEKRINAPVTSSAGRLFDAVAALIGLRQCVTFEGQAAMALEYTAAPNVDEAYPFEIHRDNAARPDQANYSGFYPPLILDWHTLVEAILADVRQGVPTSIISARFHNALVESILQVAFQIGVPRVALTGGCFQSRLLTERVANRLKKAGFDVLLHHQVPPNDGGISLGQVIVAAAQLGQPEKQGIKLEESDFTSA